jgi:hypothetical protein
MMPRESSPYRPYRIMPQSNLKQYLVLMASILVALAGHKDVFGGHYADALEIGGVIGAVVAAWAVRRD